jgi:ATP synthase protein I
MKNASNKEGRSAEEKVAVDIGRKAERKLRARGQADRSVWFGLGMFGLVGWAVAIPTLLGIALGFWLDRKLSGRVSWTLTGLVVGVVLGCLNAWFWVERESGQTTTKKQKDD